MMTLAQTVNTITKDATVEVRHWYTNELLAKGNENGTIESGEVFDFESLMGRKVVDIEHNESNTFGIAVEWYVVKVV